MDTATSTLSAALNSGKRGTWSSLNRREAFGAGVMSKSEQKLFNKKPNAEAGQAYHFYNCPLEISLT